MIKRCFACGVGKDTEVEAFYPYKDENDNICTDSPVDQLFVIDCTSNNGKDGCRICVMCHECWHRLCEGGGIDMWIDENCWKSLNPVISFIKLPLFDLTLKDRWNPENYTGDFNG